MRRQFFLFMLFGATLLTSGCAPVSKTEVRQPVVENLVVETEAALAPKSTELPGLVETVTATLPLAVPTSRGDQLVATDPATVNLSAGAPTLVEFFRFT